MKTKQNPGVMTANGADKDPSSLMASDSISDKLKLLGEMNAAMTKITYRNAAGKLIAAAVFVRGAETEEIIDAVDAVDASWEV